MTTRGLFKEYFEDAVAEPTNEELRDLIRAHMGTLWLGVLDAWVKEAFEEGMKYANPT